MDDERVARVLVSPDKKKYIIMDEEGLDSRVQQLGLDAVLAGNPRQLCSFRTGWRRPDKEEGRKLAAAAPHQMAAARWQCHSWARCWQREVDLPNRPSVEWGHDVHFAEAAAFTSWPNENWGLEAHASLSGHMVF